MIMKKYAFLLLMLFMVFSISAKDISAWKKETNLERQYEVFKKNLNYWNLQYFLTPDQMDQFYGAVTDSIKLLENEAEANLEQIASLQKELKDSKTKTKSIQQELDASIKRENTISVFGMNVKKNIYSMTLYLIIVGVLFLSAIVFLMFKRSNAVTSKTKKEYEELKEEFEVHKKNSLDRYTKINTELHKARMELKNKD